MKIIHEKDKCIKCGMCVSLCSEYWEFKDGEISLIGSKKKEKNFELKVKKIECNKVAEEVCPVKCIKIKSTI